MNGLVEFVRARLAGQAENVESVHDFGCAEIRYDGTCTCGWPEQLARDIKAKERIADAHPIIPVGRYGQSFAGPKPQAFGCETCHDDDGVTVGAGYCDTWKALASTWDSHKNYRAEWAVD